MADTATLAAPRQPVRSGPDEELPEGRSSAGQRGRLDIAQRAVERIAEITTRRLPTVAHQTATFGRGLPKARARIAGRRVHLQVEIAIAWGHPLAEVAALVRGQVAAAIEEFTHLGVDSVDVHVCAVEITEPVNHDLRRTVL